MLDSRYSRWRPQAPRSAGRGEERKTASRSVTDDQMAPEGPVSRAGNPPANGTGCGTRKPNGPPRSRGAFMLLALRSCRASALPQNPGRPEGLQLPPALAPAPRPRVGGRATHLRDESQPLFVADEFTAQLDDPVAQEGGLLELQVLGGVLHLLLHLLDQAGDLVLGDGAGGVRRGLLG